MPVPPEPFGVVLRRLRERAGLTQEQLAERARLSPRAIRALERGERRRPYPHTIHSIVKALELSADERTDLMQAGTDRRSGGAYSRGDLSAAAIRVLTSPIASAAAEPDRNPFFVGRGDELQRLHTLLATYHRVDIFGLGGVGKTELAIQYLHAQRSDYPRGVYWLRGRMPDTLLGDMANLISIPDLDVPSKMREDVAVRVVLDWMRQADSWLLVIDDLTDESYRAIGTLLVGTKGDIIVTSRTPRFPVRLRVEPLEASDAANYLQARAADDDPMAAARLADRLGGLPLALTQARSYMLQTGESLGGYLSLLDQDVQLLDERLTDSAGPTILEAWDLSIDQIRQDSLSASLLLQLCSFLSAERIPVSLLLKVGHIPDDGSECQQRLHAALETPLSCNRTLSTILRFSMMTRSGGVLQVHPLVQEAIRSKMTVAELRFWAAAAVRLVEGAFPAMADRPMLDNDQSRELMPHGWASAKRAMEQGVEGSVTGQLLERMARSLVWRGHLRQAELALRYSLQCIAPNGGSMSDRARRLLALGSVLKLNEDNLGARMVYNQVATIVRANPGFDDRITAEYFYRFGLLLHDLGDLDSSRSSLERALEMQSALYDTRSSVVVAATRLALGHVLLDTGDMRSARRHIVRALSQFVMISGENHWHTAGCHLALGKFLQAVGEFAAARSEFETAIAIDEAMLGPVAANVAHDHYSIACLLLEMDDLDGAQLHAERAELVHSQALDGRHPSTLRDRRLLANIKQLRDRGHE